MVPFYREQCAACGHAFSFHGRKPDTPCKALGCRDKTTHLVCVAFVPREDASPELREALSAAA